MGRFRFYYFGFFCISVCFLVSTLGSPLLGDCLLALLGFGCEMKERMFVLRGFGFLGERGLAFLGCLRYESCESLTVGVFFCCENGRGVE